MLIGVLYVNTSVHTCQILNVSSLDLFTQPCRRFAPILKESYESWKAKRHEIEIIFVTSDQNEKAFQEYFAAQGDWLAYPFGHEGITTLKERYNVKGIPTFIVIDSTGQTIDEEGRGTVVNHKENAMGQWVK